MKKIFFGGSRRLGRLNQQVQERASNMIDEGLVVLVGDANGADKAIQKFFAERAYSNVIVFFAGSLCRNNLGNWRTHPVPVKDRARFSILRGKRLGDERGSRLRLHDLGWRKCRNREQHPESFGKRKESCCLSLSSERVLDL